ncbi:MAG: DUF465 domain-containing protein [Pseudomonadota bacterium]
MSVDAHIQQLKQRHRSLEDQLHELTNSPSASDAERQAVKQQKLKLKDEIARLETTH